jgi:uncharacterized membrane protein YhaH (DUF805 family)
MRRITRLPFFLIILGSIGAAMALSSPLSDSLSETLVLTLHGAIVVALLWASLARLKDTGLPGANLVLLLLVPVGPLILAAMMFKKSTHHPEIS